MSGGSYEYICFAEPDGLLEKKAEIQEMADRLAGLGYAQDAAKETMILLLTVRQFENRIKAMQERLSGVWKAVEWWDSCDTSEDGVLKALEIYRGNQDT